MASAPSKVLLPPMKPAACTKTHPSTPDSASSSASLMPRHAAGSGRRLSKLEGVNGIACILQIWPGRS